MELEYSGQAMYRGPDEEYDGLVHGKHYHVDIYKMANGKRRVSIDDPTVRIKKMTFKDKYTCESAFLRRHRK